MSINITEQWKAETTAFFVDLSSQPWTPYQANGVLFHYHRLPPNYYDRSWEDGWIPRRDAFLKLERRSFKRKEAKAALSTATQQAMVMCVKVEVSNVIK
ncbi:unnamed protein product [Fusarium graminearum]|uniref:Chromosome 4, complete genome n=1 Tax=Gibberella zeae (strain ATCC MYA-4620 / CBS 123657 / FGSC 9075 / NRRL 31084 / PH-1) TaxID=229533 RepID=A0A098DT86_GIBZE|nr:unnamed protein product [Fusarium graminearum]CEF84043.1 unnamed protein product [Fusarium graminearum]